MTLNGLLKHTCTITPRNSTDNRLNENARSLGTAVTGIACFFQVKTVRDVQDERAELMSVEGYQLFLKPAQTVSVGDEVSNILDAEGNEVVSGTFTVETVATHGSPRRNHHKTVMLKK